MHVPDHWALRFYLRLERQRIKDNKVEGPKPGANGKALVQGRGAET